MGDVLSLKELNRATLARQMLLARERTPVLKAVERLAGLQPFVGLSRQARQDLAEEGRALVGFAEPDSKKTEVRFV